MKTLIAMLVAFATLTLAGCQTLGCLGSCGAHSRNASSLVDFLYPDGQLLPPATTLPQLHIPLRVGLAFLPSLGSPTTGLDEAHKEQLLSRIRQRFASRGFISQIVVLPDYYLTGRTGFEALNGVQRLYSLDVIALVSFDQDSHLDANRWSLAYATVVGAYVVKGSRHDVSTLVDLAVVDPVSRQLIIRAGGTDLRHGSTTLVDASRRLREADITGFDAATDQMIGHFDAELTKFEADVRSGTAPVRIVSNNAPGHHGGGGALDGVIIGLLLLAVARRAASLS